MFSLSLSAEAQHVFEAADGPLQRKLDRAFKVLTTDPYHHNNIKRLSGKLKGRSRFRVGDWRIIFVIEEKKQNVFVSDIAHRSEVYE